MPARAHAIIVARAGRSACAQLSRTLDALSAQSLPPAAVTVVVLGDAAPVRALPGIGHIVEGIIEARTSTTFSEAVALAGPRVSAGSAVWLLAEDTVPEPDALQLLAGALERARAYADAGASGFFVPGLMDERLIARVCEAAPLPVNIMMFAGVPGPRRLGELGVARVSHGPGPYRQAMAALTAAAREALAY